MNAKKNLLKPFKKRIFNIYLGLKFVYPGNCDDDDDDANYIKI